MHVAASDAEDHTWFVVKAAVRADLPAEGQSDTRSWVSLMPCEQSGLDNAQNLFTGKDWTGRPKDKFNSVLTLLSSLYAPWDTALFLGSLHFHESLGECPGVSVLHCVGPRTPAVQTELGPPCH